MNTSKSLDSILDTIDFTKAGPSGYLDDKANERKAAVKQAIVEAVEGLIGEDIDVKPLMPLQGIAQRAAGQNQEKWRMRKAIKEWQ